MIPFTDHPNKEMTFRFQDHIGLTLFKLIFANIVHHDLDLYELRDAMMLWEAGMEIQNPSLAGLKHRNAF